MTNIRPCLWFDGHAEEAAALYVSPMGKIIVADIEAAATG